MAKSEKEELEELRKSYGDLNETVEKLGKALHFLMSKPSQKAVVATDPKLAEKPVLTRDQVLAKLKIKAQDLDLKKSDRELITAFAVKEVSVEAVEHLLK
jgi:archaellum component FlaC